MHAQRVSHLGHDWENAVGMSVGAAWGCARRWLLICLVTCIGAVAPSTTGAAEGTTSVAKTTRFGDAIAYTVAIKSTETKTTVRLELSRAVPAEVFTLGDPYRVIVDLPDVSFALTGKAGARGEGLVSGYRYGQFAKRKARVVLDTVAPVLIERAEIVPGAEAGVILELALAKTDAATFGDGTGAGRDAEDGTGGSGNGPKSGKPGPGEQAAAGKAEAAAAGAKRAASRPKGKPVVVIDAGHGGIDPGALGRGSTHEKSIVLAVARRLEAQLDKSGRYSVFLTRESDVFVSLDRRVQASQSREADVFISLHADSIADKRFARTVSGATVYTLSERASDEQARLMAEKENSVDALAGIDPLTDDKAPEVRDILIDLLKRETANFSHALANAVVSRLRGGIRLSRKPRRSADFKVLRQTRTPAVLIELGYMSNERDEKMMAGKKWQLRAALAIASAVDLYFLRRGGP